MTDREKAIVMAYTGVAMLTGEKFDVFHEYIEKILGRPVYTHELAFKSVWEQIKEKSKNDFLDICATSDERPTGEWEEPFEMNGKTYHKCTNCHISSELILIDKFCPECGAKMKGGAS